MAQTDSRPMKAVVNSTPLIALSMLKHLFVLKALFDEIFVPSSLTRAERPVSREFVAFRRKEQMSRLREFFINILPSVFSVTL